MLQIHCLKKGQYRTEVPFIERCWKHLHPREKLWFPKDTQKWLIVSGARCIKQTIWFGFHSFKEKKVHCIQRISTFLFKMYLLFLGMIPAFFLFIIPVQFPYILFSLLYPYWIVIRRANGIAFCRILCWFIYKFQKM